MSLVLPSAARGGPRGEQLRAEPPGPPLSRALRGQSRTLRALPLCPRHLLASQFITGQTAGFAGARAALSSPRPVAAAMRAPPGAGARSGAAPGPPASGDGARPRPASGSLTCAPHPSPGSTRRPGGLLCLRLLPVCDEDGLQGARAFFQQLSHVSRLAQSRRAPGRGPTEVPHSRRLK